MYFYRLGTLITVERLDSSYSALVWYMQFFDYFGHLYLPHAQLLLKLSPIQETLNPSCSSLAASKFFFTNHGCSACSSKAKQTEKGVCELAWDVANLPYLNKNISADLPVNINGEKMELKLREEYLEIRSRLQTEHTQIEREVCKINNQF